MSGTAGVPNMVKPKELFCDKFSTGKPAWLKQFPCHQIKTTSQKLAKNGWLFLIEIRFYVV